MKKSFLIFISLIFSLFIISCDTTEPDDDPNSLGGDTNVPISQVGNVVSTGSVTIGNQSYDIGGEFEVISNNNGLATLQVKADLRNVPGLSAFNDFIPSSMKDANGRVNTTVQFKVTSEGMQDNMNVDGKLHTLVKYNAKVGDSYKITTSNGKTITRTVTERTDQDDFPYGFFNIKTIKVEQDSRVPGVRNFVYRLNHKFGLVFVEIIMEDGSSAKVYLYSAN
ncbi:MAG TPA: hypothetical protein ENN33_02875 [Ignavibacteria bacterium]|nr:hypothetical protein [Ignavibacteria bacterium]